MAQYCRNSSSPKGKHPCCQSICLYVAIGVIIIVALENSLWGRPSCKVVTTRRQDNTFLKQQNSLVSRRNLWIPWFFWKFSFRGIYLTVFEYRIWIHITYLITSDELSCAEATEEMWDVIPLNGSKQWTNSDRLSKISLLYIQGHNRLSENATPYQSVGNSKPTELLLGLFEP